MWLLRMLYKQTKAMFVIPPRTRHHSRHLLRWRHVGVQSPSRAFRRPGHSRVWPRKSTPVLALLRMMTTSATFVLKHPYFTNMVSSYYYLNPFYHLSRHCRVKLKICQVDVNFAWNFKLVVVLSFDWSRKRQIKLTVKHLLMQQRPDHLNVVSFGCYIWSSRLHRI